MIARLTFRISMLSLFVASAVACSGSQDKELDDLKVEVAKLRQDLATAYTRITSLEGEVDALSGGTGLAELQSHVDTLQTTVGSHTTRLDSLETAVSATSDHTSRLDTLESAATSHASRLDGLETAVSATSDHTGRLASLETKTAAMTATDVDGKAAVVFTGVNVHIRNGHQHGTESANGLGNLIVGYNEPQGDAEREGSHNLVVGRGHNYKAYAGLVTGMQNALSAPYAAIAGGAANTASGWGSAILGSVSCEAPTVYATVYGGDGRDGGSLACQAIEP